MAAPGTGILGFGAYTPERVFTNDDWSRYVDTSDEWITTRTGIKRRRFAADGENTVDMAEQAARIALASAGLAADDVAELIVATDTPEVYAPDSASFLQHRLGVGEVPAYDLAGSGCAGFLLGLDLARARALAHGGKVLVVGVELISRLMDWEDRNTCVLFGDAAGAAVVAAGAAPIQILAATAGTDGSKADILMREVGGTRSPFTLERAEAREHLDIAFHGREVFREAVSRMTQASHEVLRAAGVDPSEIDLVVPHQANLRILNAVANALKLPEEKFFVEVEEYGNTGSASVPLALYHAHQQGRIRSGDTVLLTAFGAGFHWAAVLLRFDAPPGA
ncbi:MAG: beta-ketoacyl-ACP synthase 3 [Thermoanaerobaculia bacterium]|nr:beta-ketoacyl-ACP synthase 3 [Thermoanaerobaculia bacterium]